MRTALSCSGVIDIQRVSWTESNRLPSFDLLRRCARKTYRMNNTTHSEEQHQNPGYFSLPAGATAVGFDRTDTAKVDWGTQMELHNCGCQLSFQLETSKGSSVV